MIRVSEHAGVGRLHVDHDFGLNLSKRSQGVEALDQLAAAAGQAVALRALMHDLREQRWTPQVRGRFTSGLQAEALSGAA